MNMKKTMAAIAAGAVAVSAMATTVSALETRTLHYNLVQSVKNDTKGDADYTVTFPSVALEVGDTVTVNVIGFGDNDEVTIRPNYNDSTYFAPSFTYTKNKDSVKYNSAIAPTGTDTFKVVENNTTEKNVFVGGKTGSSVIKTGTVTLAGTQTAKLDVAVNKDTTLTYITETSLQTAFGTTIKANGQALNTNKATAGTTDGWYTVNATALATAIAADSSLSSLAADATQAELDTALANVLKAGTIKRVTSTDLRNTYGIITNGDEVANDELLITAAKPALATIYVDVLDKDFVANDFAAVNTALTNGTIGVSITVNHADGTSTPLPQGASVLNAFTGNKSVTKYPYKSSLNNTIYSNQGMTGTTLTDGNHGGDVLSHIWTVKDDDNSTQINPVSVRAVINDAIQQHNGEVTFVFNTAAKKVSLRDANDTWGTPNGAYVDNDWDVEHNHVGDYTSFGNHYYQGLQYGYDANLDYYVNNWKPDNLFSGLLLVNSNLTLSLSDTEKFDWTEKSLSFTWEAIEDSALTANQYANYVQNMVLRTSQDWYWDSLDVVLADVETAGIGVGAPTDAPEDDIDDEEDEVDDFEIDEPEEPADEPEEPADEPEEPADVAPAAVSNPTTGNASVALAVIPVALAAAAIVAKKRG